MGILLLKYKKPRLEALIFLLLVWTSTQWCLKTSLNHTDDVTKIDFSPDNTYFATTSSTSTNRVVIYDSVNYLIQFIYTPPATKTVKTARFTKDAIYLGVGLNDGTVLLISGRPPFSSTALITLTTGITNLIDIDFNIGKTKMVACFSGGNIYKVVSSYAGTSSITSVTTTNPNLLGCKFSIIDQVATIDSSGKMITYTSAGAVNTTMNPTGGNLIDLDVRPSGSILKVIMGGVNNKGYFGLNGAGVTANTFLTNPTSQIAAACYSPDSLYYAYGGQDARMWIFDQSNNNNTDTYNYASTAHKCCDFNYNGEYLVMGTAASSSIAQVFVYKKSCFDCDVGFYQSGTTSCTACTATMSGCAMCINSTTCMQCFQGYFVSNYSCLTCATYINGCSACSNSTICFQCSPGYYLLSNSTCAPCTNIFPGCLACNSTNCINCQFDYYLTSGNCTRCSAANCLRCTAVNTCVTCASSYFISGTSCSGCLSICLECYAANNNCTSCIRGYYLAGNTCTACTLPCLECKASTNCVDCATGFYVSSGSCNACSSNCVYCSLTTCLTCAPGFYLLGVSCTPCGSNCSACSSATNCSSCTLGYYLSSTTCTFCTSLSSQCTECTPTACLSCASGYFPSGTTCPTCSSMFGCTHCTSSINCLRCSPGLYLTASSGNSSCASCPFPCSNCLTSSSCTACVTGYYLTANTCTACPVGCPTCFSPTNCSSCTLGYYLSGITCNQCAQAGCIDCLSNTNCVSCTIGYYLAGTTCQNCASPCTTCNSTGCITCQLGYYLSGTSCTKCIVSCAQCKTATDCQACNVGYYLNTALSSNQCTICSSLSSACETCTINNCLSCQDGHYLQSSTTCNHCSTVTAQCLHCTSTACFSCSAGYYLASSTSCLPCSNPLLACLSCSSSTNCFTCASGFYLSTSICYSCPLKCSTCLSAISCLQCSSGYYSIGSDCVICQSALTGCETCAISTACLSCSTGYYLSSSSSCLSCRSALIGCLLCDSFNVCTVCQENYYLNSNICTPCETQAGCQLCSSSTVCLSCLSGYYLQTSICFLCTVSMPGCIYCQSDSLCQQCQSGYYLDSSFHCQLCKNILPGCIFCSSSSNCLQCDSGYYLSTPSLTCQPCSQQGCEVCLESNPLKCLNCNSGYYLSIDTCIACPQAGCLNCPTSTSCITCQTGYYLNSNTCTLCSSPLPGCTKCSSALTCLECDPLFYLSGTTCATCSTVINGCSFCVVPTTCLSCDTGYYLSSSICQLCSTLPGCLMCADAITCLSCSTGYYLSGSSCASCNSITNCYQCISSTVCSVCVSGFTISATGTCTAMMLSSGSAPIQQTPNLSFKTYYVDYQTLKHVLQAKGMIFQQLAINWTTQVKIYLESKANSTLLIINKVEWGTNGNQLYFYTNNPLSFEVLSLPIIEGRLLVGQSIDPNIQSSMSMTQTTINQILPSMLYDSDVTMSYNLSDPQFYSSYLQIVKKGPFYMFGLIMSILFFTLFLLKAICLAPFSTNHAEISGHVLALKTVPLILYPTYAQYINYSFGFMTFDLPWLNNLLPFLSNPTDFAPKGYLMFYPSMNFAAMYLAPIILVFILLGIGYLALHEAPSPSLTETKKAKINSMDNFNSYYQFILNFFVFGIVFAGCSSLQGSFLNSSQIFSISGSFYLLGTIIFTIFMAEAFLNIYREGRICRVRASLKAALLATAHFNPLYIATTALILDFVLIIVEYRARKIQLITPKIWATSHIIAFMAFAFYLFIPDSLLTLMLVSFAVVIIFFLQFFITYKEYNSGPVHKGIVIGQKIHIETEDYFWNINGLSQLKNDEQKDQKDSYNEQNEMNLEQTRYISTKAKGFKPSNDVKKRNRRFRKDNAKDPYSTTILKVKKTQRTQKQSHEQMEELSDF